MERYKFARLYIQLARVMAFVAFVASVIMGFATKTGIGFFVSLLGGFIYVFLILVGADFLSCFLQIEENTRTAPQDGRRADTAG